MSNRLIFGKRYEYNNEYFTNPLKFGFARLYQVGELFCEAGYQIPEHRQHCYEISYIVTGKGTFMTDGRECSVTENDVFINSVGQMHAIRADKGTPLRYCYLAFSLKDEAAHELQTFYNGWQGNFAVPNKDLLTPFSDIFSELQSKSDFFLPMVGAYVEQIVIEVYRAFQGNTPVTHTAEVAETRMGSAAYTVMRYIDQHYRDITDIRAVAKQLGYSYTYLAHVFKEKTGMTIGSYIIQKKMEEAKWLLRTGRMNVSQVASRINYMSVQSFSNSFKKAVGVSPAEYQSMSHLKEREASEGLPDTGI